MLESHLHSIVSKFCILSLELRLTLPDCQIAVDTDQTTRSPFEQGLLNGTGLTTIKKTDIGPAHILKTNTRPPLAGPFAFSRLPKPVWDYPRVHIMHETQPTWLFVNFSSG